MINLYRVVDNLISLAENKYEQLQEIYLLTQQQTNTIEESDIELLDELIEKKQEKIELIRGFDSQFQAITNDIKTIFEVKSLDELEEESTNITFLNEILSKVNSILHQIIQMENVNKEKINLARNQLERKIGNARTGKTAIKQYSGIQVYSDAVFFDKKIK